MGLVALALSGCAAKRELVPLEVGGESRSYWIHRPEGLAEPAPVMLMFHGGGGSADRKGKSVAGVVGFDDVADREGFVVVYPNAVDGNWNDTREPSEHDDVAYVDAVLASLGTTVDPARIHVAGISNGGFFAQRLACERSERFASVAAVAATFPVGLACDPAVPVPILFVPGTDDPVVPYAGGEIPGGRGQVTSVDEAVAGWVSRNGCTDAPVRTDWPDTADDGTTVHEERWCAGEGEVRLLAIEGGGHTWPGGRQYAPRFLIGRVSRELDASEEIWAWSSGFQR